MSLGQRVRYIGPREDRHGFSIPYTYGTVTREADENGENITVEPDKNAYAQSWTGHVDAFERSWVPVR